MCARSQPAGPIRGPPRRVTHLPRRRRRYEWDRRGDVSLQVAVAAAGRRKIPIKFKFAAGARRRRKKRGKAEKGQGKNPICNFYCLFRHFSFCTSYRHNRGSCYRTLDSKGEIKLCLRNWRSWIWWQRWRRRRRPRGDARAGGSRRMLLPPLLLLGERRVL